MSKDSTNETRAEEQTPCQPEAAPEGEMNGVGVPRQEAAAAQPLPDSVGASLKAVVDLARSGQLSGLAIVAIGKQNQLLQTITSDLDIRTDALLITYLQKAMLSLQARVADNEQKAQALAALDRQRAEAQAQQANSNAN